MAKSTDTPTGWYPGAQRVTVPNFTPGRGGQIVLASTQHVTAGAKGKEFPNCITWFQNPAAQASAHFLFGKQGEIVQFVSIEDTAWANGLLYATAPKKGLHWDGAGWYNARGHKCFPTWPLLARPVSPNLTTVSMEHAGQSDEPWTAPMFNATVDVLRWLGAARRIVWTPHRTLIGHYELDTADKRNCPGPHVEWERLAAAANEAAALPPTPAPSPPAQIDPLRVRQLQGIDRVYFCGSGFFDYYHTYGGLRTFGYPLSDEAEIIDTAGEHCTMMRCERAVLKYKASGKPWAVQPALLSELQKLGLV